jgi:hypothetical protein
MGPVRAQRCPARLHVHSHTGAWFSVSCREGVYPTANASSGLFARFSPHLELSMQGEPPSVQGPCCREVIIEGKEQLPLQQECSAG